MVKESNYITFTKYLIGFLTYKEPSLNIICYSDDEEDQRGGGRGNIYDSEDECTIKK